MRSPGVQHLVARGEGDDRLVEGALGGERQLVEDPVSGHAGMLCPSIRRRLHGDMLLLA
jgi:hypothetical protein